MSDTVQVVDNNPTKPKQCHAGFAVDGSGSMSPIRKEVVDAYNEQLRVLEKESEDIPTNITIVKFASVVEKPIIFETPVKEVKPITEEDYRPDGMTAMLDGVGYLIDEFKKLPDADDPDTVFIINVISDGAENNSKNEDYASISEKIQACKATGRWTFSYMGCNQDLSILSARMGLSKGDTRMFVASAAGVATSSLENARMYSCVYDSYRSGSRGVDNAYLNTIDADANVDENGLNNQ